MVLVGAVRVLFFQHPRGGHATYSTLGLATGAVPGLAVVRGSDLSLGRRLEDACRRGVPDRGDAPEEP